MLLATVKLCCAITHDHLPGLKGTAIAAIQKDARGLVVRGSRHPPSKIPRYIQRLVAKKTAVCLDPNGDVDPSRISSVDLSYIAQGETALQRALSILQHRASWQEERMLDTRTKMSSAALPGLGKVFQAEVVLAVPVARLHRELFERIEQMPQWNPTLSRVKVLQQVGTDTLVTHEVTAPSPGNLVGQRDFVSVRHCGRRDTTVYLVPRPEPLPLQDGCV
ncbi:PREDICTED: steroidogenic acute regulatory protein, mitochondrial-like, partial [Apaloderma vittatum]|uniref:steroidogenic acute regulatory protein, mitochondrial-like n=1 Tax=Apaloderma vittatum TaxID=57397 RepID=UPI0005211DE9